MIETTSGLSIVVYKSGMARLPDPGNELIWAEGLQFRGGYPGGRSLDASFYLPRDLSQWLPLNGAQRMAFFEGTKMVYEGYIWRIKRVMGRGGEQGIMINLGGPWGDIMMKRALSKPWSDRRQDESVWKQQAEGSAVVGLAHANVDRNNRIRIVPNTTQSWNNNEYTRHNYTVPTGETIKRITCDYDFNEQGQVWRLGMATSAVTHWEVTTTGTGSQDVTLGTPSQTTYLFFQNVSGGAQTASSGVYGQVSNLTVYTETGAINLTEIAKDLVGKFPDSLNSDVSKIASNTQSLVPFIADDDWLADILDEAAAHGDTSHLRWAYGLLPSDRATTPNGKSVLFCEQFPPLTDWDIEIGLGDENIDGDITIDRDFERIANHITVRWSDENGWAKRLTPDDDATLKDQTSIDKWGGRPRQGIVQLGYSTQAVAVENAKRHLAWYKDPIWTTTEPIRIMDYVRTKRGAILSASEIYPGMRVRLNDFVDELTGEQIIMLITGTDYNDDDMICTITCGQPLSPLMTILEAPVKMPVDEILTDIVSGGVAEDGGGGGDGGSGPDRLNWRKREHYKRFAKRMGIDISKVKAGKEKAEFIKKFKKEKKKRG